jgi:single-stranded-DNA-specific exonuclease
MQDLNDGLSMKDMEKGIEIIIDGISNNKKIVIYGDYDCDGVTSTTILYKALKKCGANLKYYIPDRENEGYGMCSDRVKLLKEEDVDIILTCDNGIAAIEQIKLAKELGITVVVTDHHEVSFITDENGAKVFKLPPADAIINPKQNNCTYPFEKLCGAGIAFKFAQILYKKLGRNHEEAFEFIEYAAIGTTCDVVDLIDENRIIVKISR